MHQSWTVTLIAGRVELRDALEQLATHRSVFHSEADFQFALGWEIKTLSPDVNIRMEVPQPRPAGRPEYLDLLCSTPEGGRTAIELKYATTSWTGRDRHGETYRLAHHAAWDLARRYYVHDVERLERFCDASPSTSGVAVMLTNVADLWGPPRSPRATQDANFRLHEGVTLSGQLTWGTSTGDGPYDARVRGEYPLTWHPFAGPDADGPEMRWLAVAVEPSAPRPGVDAG